MGYHIILEAICEIKPEFIPLIEKEYLKEYLCRLNLEYPEIYCDDNASPWERDPSLIGSVEVPEEYKALLEEWRDLRIGPHFYKYDLSGTQFHLRIEKKPHRHTGYLNDDYMAFMMNVMMPMSSMISMCVISEDDYGCQESHYSWAHLERKYKKLNGNSYKSYTPSNITYYD